MEIIFQAGGRRGSATCVMAFKTFQYCIYKGCFSHTYVKMCSTKLGI